MGRTTLVAMLPAASMRPMSFRASKSTGLVVYGSAPTFCAHRRIAPDTPSTALAVPSAAFCFGSAASLSLPTESTARFDMRPRLTPSRLTPLPTPLAVSTGSVTTFAVLLPTLTTAPPADLRNTSLFDTSSSEARARISFSRVASSESPIAFSSP
jgi:hypothetical protein